MRFHEDGGRETGPGAGEADECTCAQCRGAPLPEWLSRLAERPEEPVD